MNQTYLRRIALAWEDAWQNNAVKLHLITSVLLFVICFQIQFYFLNKFQFRQGMMIHDRILEFFTPRDFSVLIFLMIYGALLGTFLLVLQYPKKIIAAFYGYALLTVMRTFSIYFVPLEPPTGMIFLNDPIARFFLFQETVVTKDLFFSGHIASISFFLFVLDDKHHRLLAFLFTVVLSVLLIIQRVHYSADVFAAPFFAYASYRFGQKIVEKWL